MACQPSFLRRTSFYLARPMVTLSYPYHFPLSIDQRIYVELRQAARFCAMLATYTAPATLRHMLAQVRTLELGRPKRRTILCRAILIRPTSRFIRCQLKAVGIGILRPSLD